MFAEERTDDGWRGLVAAQAVGIGGRHDGGFQQSVVAIDGHEGLDDEGDEAQRLVGRTLRACGVGFARGVEQGALSSLPFCGEAPVVVLARAVDAVEGLLVEQHAETVVAGHALHERHEQHVVVDGEVAVLQGMASSRA